MADITPALVAAVASKLYNESAGCRTAQDSFETTSRNNAVDARSKQTVDRVSSVTAATHRTTDQVHQSSIPSTAGISTRPIEQMDLQPPSVKSPASGVMGLERINQAFLKAANPSMANAKTSTPEGEASRQLISGLESKSNLNQQRLPASVAQVDGGLQRFVRDVRGAHSQANQSIKFAKLGRTQEKNFGYENAFHNITSQQGTASRPYDVNAIRRDFPILHQQVNGRQLVWFDNAATTQKPQSVIDAVYNYYARDNSNIHRAAHSLAARSTDAFEAARRKVQQFIGAGSTNEIVWVRGTTEGINFVAQTFGRKFLLPNDEILLSTLEHHANIVPWQLIARETGAKLRVIPVNDAGEIIMSEYQALLGPRTKIVAITQASNSLGTILPVAEMTSLAHRYGARVLVDGAQSIAHFPVNVRDIGCDFFVFSGHKLFAPMGVGVVYVREELLDLLPPWQGGGNMIRNVAFEETTFADPPAKFEAGTPTVADAIGLGAAIDYLHQLGMDNVARHEHDLLQYATERLSRIDGLSMIGHPREKVSVISFVLQNRKTEDVGKALDQNGIAVRAGHHCAQPSLRRFGVETTVRPSFSIYNTFEEIDRLDEAIRRIIHR